MHLHQLQKSCKSTRNLSLDLNPMVKEVERSICIVFGTGVMPRPWQMEENTMSPSHVLDDLYCDTNKSMVSELSA